MKLRHYQITSPIEQILYIAMHAMAEVHGIYQSGLTIRPQQPVDFYKVDCFLWSIDIETRVRKRAVLECDCWQYHGRSPEQSTAGKRDRYFQRQGMMTLRYSGQEIWANPCFVAAQALATIQPSSITHPQDFYRGGVDRNQYFYSRNKDRCSQTDVVAKAEALLRAIQ